MDCSTNLLDVPSTKPGKEQVVFDHPTPLDEEGDIARMLESFRCLKGDFKVVIVIGRNEPVAQ